MLYKIKEKITTDFSGFIFGKIRKYRLLFYQKYTTLLSRLFLILKGIELGKRSSFVGLPIVNRSYGSKIIIGSNCKFRSDKTSNLIGLNRRCILATFGEKSKIEIGNGSGFSGASIGAANSITIGENVLCGANVLVTDFDWHPINPDKRHTSDGVKNAPVVIGNNVWLGINSVVLKGVIIGDNTIIGANSLVVSNIPANVIAGGNPCKVIKSLISE